MPSITFDLETVTPLFLSGADQTTAELRPPAFRGALRYWFRAIAASIANEAIVREWENKVFGNTDSGGAVIIRVQSQDFTSNNSLSEKKEDYPGLNYLFFSMFSSGSRPARAYFKSDTSFKVILQTRLPNQENSICLKLAAGAMWSLINLGSVGSRSNRGAGSLQCKRANLKGINLDLPSFSLAASNRNELATVLSQGIIKVRQVYSEIFGETPTLGNNARSFDILANGYSNIYIWQPEIEEDTEDWAYILDNLGSKYQDFRRRYKNATQDDYPQVKEWIRSRGTATVQTVKRAAFGLPIQFYFTSLPKPNNKASLEATQRIDRSSSPLHFKVCQLEDESFAVVIIHFKTKLLPDHSTLRLRSKFKIKSNFEPRSTNLQAPNQDIIDEFIQYLGNLISVVL